MKFDLGTLSIALGIIITIIAAFTQNLILGVVGVGIAVVSAILSRTGAKPTQPVEPYDPEATKSPEPVVEAIPEPEPVKEKPVKSVKPAASKITTNKRGPKPKK